jgi:hypothetical protein
MFSYAMLRCVTKHQLILKPMRGIALCPSQECAQMPSLTDMWSKMRERYPLLRHMRLDGHGFDQALGEYIRLKDAQVLCRDVA